MLCINYFSIVSQRILNTSARKKRIKEKGKYRRRRKRRNKVNANIGSRTPAEYLCLFVSAGGRMARSSLSVSPSLAFRALVAAFATEQSQQSCWRNTQLVVEWTVPSVYTSINLQMHSKRLIILHRFMTHAPLRNEKCAVLSRASWERSRGAAIRRSISWFSLAQYIDDGHSQ